MLTYGNPSRNFLPYLKTESYLDTLLPELASYPFPKNDGQDVIDRLLSDETGGYRGALEALNSEFSTGQYSRPERTYEPLKPGIRVSKSIY